MEWILFFFLWWVIDSIGKETPQITKQTLNGHSYICNGSGHFIHDPDCNCHKPKPEPHIPTITYTPVKPEPPKRKYLPPIYAKPKW